MADTTDTPRIRAAALASAVVAAVYGRPWLPLLVFALVTLAALPLVHEVPLGNDLESLLSGSPAYPTYRRFLERFGSDEGVVVVVEAPALAAPTLVALRQGVAALGACPGVTGAASVLDLVPTEVRGSEAALREWLARPLSPGRLREAVERSRAAQGRLVARDGSAVAVLLSLELPVGGGPAVESRRASVVEGIRTCVAGQIWPGPVHVLGYPVVEARVLALVAQSNHRLMPLSIVVGAVVLFLATRRLLFLAAALVAVLGALVWLLASFALRGYALTAFSTMLFPLVLAVGLTTTVHVLAAHVEARRVREGLAAKGVDRDALAAVLPPCLLCTATTFIGFASLGLNETREVANFGLFAAAGVVFALVAALLVIPPALALLPWEPPPVRGQRTGTALAAFVRRVHRRRRLVVVLVLVVVGISTAGLARLRVESASVRGLSEGDPVLVALRTSERLFEPPRTLEVVLEGAPGTFGGLEGFRLLRRLGEAAVSVPGVVASLSGADVLLDGASWVAKRRREDLASERELVLTRRLLEGTAAESLLAAFVTSDGAAARLRLAVRPDGSLALLALSRAVIERLRPLVAPGLGVGVTGRYYLSALTHRTTMRNELSCFLLSVTAIVLVMMAAFRSFWLGLLAVVPNVLPLMATYATMGWLGVSFDVTTGMILAVTMGLVVDDTIHYVAGWLGERRRGAPPLLALALTSRRVGRPIVVTSVVLTAGLLILTASPFRMLADFGVFTALTVVYALVADLVILPALLAFVPGLGRAGR